MHPLIERLRQEGSPLIDGNLVTFGWQGDSAPALISDLSDWEYGPVALDEIADQVWIYRTELPLDAYIEYAYLDGDKDQRIPDPFNKRTTPNGLGDTNHFFYMPAASPVPLTRRARGIPRGKLTKHYIENDFFLVGKKRAVYLYQPPTNHPSPLVVVFDGVEYLRRCKLVPMVENLIAQKRIPPMALALVAHAGQARAVEYACSEATLGYLWAKVLPLAQQELNLIDPVKQIGSFGIMGASMGGLMALYSGLRMPHIFGCILSQSGAFALFGHDTVVDDLVRYGPVRPINIWMDVGRYDFLLESNRRMSALLVEKKYDIAYREYSGGHNFPSWRDNVWRGLEALFGSHQ
jgi:enterochelin esterase family protein